MKHMGMAFSLVMAGVLLMATAMDSGLPSGYWDGPQATKGSAPHDWSLLEKNLQPEACAQCHATQFNAWKDSKHAHAYSSGMVGQFPDMGYDDANSCLQCHAPLAEQLYKNGKDMADSIRLRLAHRDGFFRGADSGGIGEQAELPLRHAGVTCAACHVRGWQRFGPPARPSMAVGYQNTPAHGGFMATKDFEQSQFCASCHQFPQSMAINGKPLENTLTEWQASSFAKKGVTCQQCHMPDRRHEFRGIHDPAMVKKGLAFSLEKQGGDAVLTVSSKWIGHAFPTYVTPLVVVYAEAFNSKGKILRTWRWEIGRAVYYNNGWQEKYDTRLQPGERRKFVASAVPDATERMGYRIEVIPDYFYKGVYRNLLSGKLNDTAGSHIQRAAKQADANDYVLFEGDLEWHRFGMP